MELSREHKVKYEVELSTGKERPQGGGRGYSTAEELDEREWEARLCEGRKECGLHTGELRGRGGQE